MQTYISLLRGINVTGHRKITMQELRKCYATMGFSNITSYIQSGNVLFTTNQTNRATLSKTIKEGIAQQFGYNDVSIFIIKPEELQTIITQNPFLKIKDVTLKALYVTFLEKIPQTSYIEAIQAYQTLADRFQIIDNIVYLYCPEGYGKTKLSNNFFENKLKVRATSRNWNSVNKLLALAANI
jgi:uncharacterized protein (DUF1697 family)